MVIFLLISDKPVLFSAASLWNRFPEELKDSFENKLKQIEDCKL